MAYASRKGELDPGKLRGSAKRIYEGGMTMDQIRDFAKTKRKKIPRSIKQAVVGKILLGVGKKMVKKPLNTAFSLMYANSLKNPLKKSLKAVTKNPMKVL